MRGQAAYSFVASAAAVLFLAATAAAQPKVGVSSRLQAAVHEHGISPADGEPYGTFTIDLALPGFAASGKTRTFLDPSPSEYVDGQQRIPFSGVDTLTTSKGQIEIAFHGTHIPLNSHASPSGRTVGPVVETGTWKIKSSNGAYQGWKGGGPWAAAIFGYTLNAPYSVEWDGYITR